MMMVMMVMMVVVMMVMMMVVTCRDRSSRRSGRRRVLARHVVENARHRLTRARGDVIDATDDTRHSACNRILSQGELRRDKSGRNADKRGDGDFLHDCLSVNVPKCIVCGPKLIPPVRNVHQ
jgi:type II secretory pathway component PulK